MEIYVSYIYPFRRVGNNIVKIQSHVMHSSELNILYIFPKITSFANVEMDGQHGPPYALFTKDNSQSCTPFFQNSGLWSRNGIDNVHPQQCCRTWCCTQTTGHDRSSFIFAAVGGVLRFDMLAMSWRVGAWHKERTMAGARTLYIDNSFGHRPHISCSTDHNCCEQSYNWIVIFQSFVVRKVLFVYQAARCEIMGNHSDTEDSMWGGWCL